MRVNIETLTLGRGAPHPLVHGVLRTTDWVVNVRLCVLLRSRKAYDPIASPMGGTARRRERGLKEARKVKISEPKNLV